MKSDEKEWITFEETKIEDGTVGYKGSYCGREFFVSKEIMRDPKVNVLNLLRGERALYNLDKKVDEFNKRSNK